MINNFDITSTVFAIAVSPLSVNVSDIKSDIRDIPIILINKDKCNESILNVENNVRQVSIKSDMYSIDIKNKDATVKILNKNTYSGLFLFKITENNKYIIDIIDILYNMFIN